MTVKVLDSANQTLAILQNVTSPIITEEINREFTFNFQTVIDGDKSNYVNYNNKIEVENNYFDIKRTKSSRENDGVFIEAECVHVSYALTQTLFTAGFTATGGFSSVATLALSGTGFTVGTVQITASQTISIKEATNARQILMQLATLYGGELQFTKYAINLLTQRGADRGVRFQYRKNLSNASVETDNFTGTPLIKYQVSVAELEFEQGFINDGSASSQHFELGDTILVIDPDLGLNASLRIVKESHDTEQRMQGIVEISNFTTTIADTFNQIKTETVAKDNIYNGCQIGPTDGFVATKSDNLSRALMNATSGIKIQRGDGSGSNWTDLLFIDTSGNLTMDGKLTVQTISGIILLEAFQDIAGGRLIINDNSGNLNIKMGSEINLTASNTAGTITLYNDDVSKPRVSLAIQQANDHGFISLMDTNGTTRLQIKGDDATVGPAFIIATSAGATPTYLTATQGFINSVAIATQAWAAQAGVQTGVAAGPGVHSHTQT